MRKPQKPLPVRILMVAINGYGHYYLKTFVEEVVKEDAVLVGVVDPEAEKSGYISWIKTNSIPVFGKIEEFFKNGFKADLTVISSPPQYHVPQAIAALEGGSNVLVDKPVGVSVESAKELIAKAEECNKWVEVGYQWSYSQAVRDLKRDIISGIYGKPALFKTICLWPRPFEYYGRNSWAGKIKDPKGELVLDSPANNACAHFLHNLLFLLGDEMNSSAEPERVNGVRCRAYDIENYDTVCLDIETKFGVRVLFYASHVTEKDRNPEFNLEFEKGKVNFVWGGEIEGVFDDGSVKNYGSPEDDSQFRKLHDSIRKVKEGGPDFCPPLAAIAQTMCVEMIHSDDHEIISFNPDDIKDDGNRKFVPGLNEKLDEAYNLQLETCNLQLIK